MLIPKAGNPNLSAQVNILQPNNTPIHNKLIGFLKARMKICLMLLGFVFSIQSASAGAYLWNADYNKSEGSIFVKLMYHWDDGHTEDIDENTKLQYSIDNGNTYIDFYNINWGTFTNLNAPGLKLSEFATLPGRDGSNNYLETMQVKIFLNNSISNITNIRLVGHWNRSNGRTDRDIDDRIGVNTLARITSVNRPTYEFLNTGVVRLTYTKDNVNEMDGLSTIKLFDEAGNAVSGDMGTQSTGFFDVPFLSSEKTYYYKQSVYNNNITSQSFTNKVPAFTLPTQASSIYSPSSQTVKLSWHINPVSSADFISDQFKILQADNANFTDATVSYKDYSKTQSDYSITFDKNLTPHMYFKVSRSHTGFNWEVSSNTDIDVQSQITAINPLSVTLALNQVDNTAILNWTASNNNWFPNGSFVITRINKTSNTQIAIPLSKTDFDAQTYIDNQISICNEYTYTLQILPASNSAFTAFSSIKLSNTILPTKIGKISGLTASKGYFPDRTELGWSSTGVFDNFIIKRAIYGSKNYYQIANVSGAATGDFKTDDTKGSPGTYYTYMVVGTINCNNTPVYSKDTLYAIGFRSPTGNVYGRITYANGQGVVNASVRLQSNDVAATGKSVYLNGNSGSFLKLDSLVTPFTDSAFTIETWIKPDDITPTNKIIFSIPNQYELGFDANGKVYFSNSSKRVSAVFTNSNQSFVHIAGIRTKDSLMIMRNDSVLARVSAAAQNINTAIDTTVYIGCNTAGNYFKGFIDEMRVWNTALSPAVIARDYTRLLSGGENGLAAYWRFDENIKNQFYDLSYQGDDFNQNDGNMMADSVIRSATIPSTDQLSLNGLTDITGNYMITGIPFTGNGTTYTIAPLLGTHTFDPSSVNRLMSASSNQFTVDFKDKSSFPVSGTVVYKDGTMPVPGVQFKIDGQYAQNTDGTLIVSGSDGTFAINVPVGFHTVQATMNNHIFANNGKIIDISGDSLINYQAEVTGLKFNDKTTIRLIGRVAGGSIEGGYPLGHSLSHNNLGLKDSIVLYIPQSRFDFFSSDNPTTKTVVVKHFLPSNQSDSTQIHKSAIVYKKKNVVIYPDPITGEFAADLIPVSYTVQSVNVTGWGNLLNGSEESLDLTEKFFVNNSINNYRDSTHVLSSNSYIYKNYMDTVTYNAAYKKIKRVDPQVSITQIDGSGTALNYFGDSTYSSVSLTGINSKIKVINSATPLEQYIFKNPVFNQNHQYKFLVKAFEEYSYHPTEQSTSQTFNVPTKDGLVSILNGIRNGPVVADTFSLNQEGKGIYSFMAGDPNLATLGLKNFSASVQFGAASTKSWGGIDGSSQMPVFVLGAQATGTTFVTAGPNKIIMVLRDPPGSTSFSYAEKGLVMSSNNTFSTTVDQVGDAELAVTLGLSVTTFVGVGAGKIDQTNATVTGVFGLHHEEHWEGSDNYVNTNTLTTNFQTSADPGFVGASADVFVGNSTNITYGASNNITIVNRSEIGSDPILFDPGNNSNYVIIQRGGIRLGEIFGTLFAYPQTHIENVLIPNLVTIRNALLLPVNSMGAQELANSTNQQVYVSMLPAADPLFGKTNSDIAFFPNNTRFDSGRSYKIFFPSIMTIAPTDSISTLNQYVSTWQKVLRDNEKSKLNSNLLQNYSFHAGSPVTYSESSSINNSHTESFHAIVSGSIGANKNIDFDKNGIALSITESVAGGHGKDLTNSTETNKNIGFTLASNGTDDYFSVDVKRDTSGNFVFRTKGGVSACPYEGGTFTKYYLPNTPLDQPTQRIEVPKISVDKPVVTDIPSSRSASYTLSVANQSEAKLSNTYFLSYADNDSIKGATLSIDGTPIGGSGRVLVVPFGTAINKVLTITKGPVAMDYNNIMVILKSACDGAIADTVLLSAHFIPSCSDIHIKAPVNNWVLNTLSPAINTKRYLPITMDQFDVNNSLFDHIELQFKPAAASAWITNMKFFADSVKYNAADGDKQMITNAQAIDYNLVMDDIAFNDQNYNIRAVSICKLSANKSVTTESDIVSGIKDTYFPRLFGSAQPANGVLGISDNIRLNFNETIASGLLSTNDFKVTGIRNGVLGDHTVSVSMDGAVNYLQTEFSKNLTGKSTTTELWVLPNKTANGTLFSQGNPNESMEVALTSDNLLQVIVGKKIINSKPLDVKPGEWAHVALVYNSTDTSVSAYYNFIPVIINAPVGVYNGIGTYQFGKSVSKNGNLFAGKLHRACVWSDTLSAITIQLRSLLQLSGAENNLIAYYPMDEGKGNICLDKAHGSNATLNGSWSTPAGKAIKFNGQGYLTLNTSFAPIPSQMDYSLELWFKGDSNQSDAALVSNGKGDNSDIGGSLNNFFLGFENKLLTFVNNGFKIQADGNYLDNNWHHVAVNVSRTSGVAQVYVDGALKTFADAKNIGGIAAANAYLGARVWNVTDTLTSTIVPHFDRYFNGSIDEFRIWNTYLNQTIINKNNNIRLKGDEIGLMAYYPFETYKTTSNNQQQMDSTLMDLKIQSDPNVIVPFATATNAVISDQMAPIKDRGPVVNLAFDYVINNDALIISMKEQKQAINKVIITLQVKNVNDLNGNTIVSPITWSAYIDQNQLKWSDVSLNLSKTINAPMQFESYVVNSGGNIQNYSLGNLPKWLTADMPSGTVQPLGKQKITFTVNEALNVGTYDEVLFMRNDNNGAEALTLNMVVKGKQPGWSVDPAAFKYSMNVYGKLRVNNLYSIDKDDILAAFVNGKCVGVAKNAYNAQSDMWFTFLTIYNDSIQNSNLKFRIWQASTGKVYQAIPSADISFVSNSIVGSVRNPIIFDGKENIFQDISLNKGWNWISFNVLDKSNATNINETLSNGNWSAGDLIKNELTGFSQYGNQSGWLGYLAGVNNTSLFTLKTNNTQSLSVSGVAVDVRVTPIPVSGNRWSYISYLPQVNLTLKDALADYDAKNEDVIKSQSGFAMYDNVVGWVGNLTFMEPGKGYMLYHNSVNNTSFYYPAIKSLFKVAPIKNYISGIGINNAQITVAANTGFAQNMTVTAKEGTGFVLQPNDVVIAYSAGEIRAKSRLIENVVLKTPTLFFNIAGEQDEAIYFQVERNGIVVAQSETVLTYGANTQVGTLSKPLLLNFTEASNAILIYPNPFVQKVMVNIKIAGSTNEFHSVQISIYNAMGQSISTLPEKQAKTGIFQTYWNGKTGAGINCTPGIYFIHITIDGVTQVQKVIKN